MITIQNYKYIRKLETFNTVVDQLLEEDWKMKIAVKMPTKAVTPNATVGSGDVRPKFSRSPFPVATSTEIAEAKPIIAARPSHTSIPLPPFVPCSHLMLRGVALQAGFLLGDILEIEREEAVEPSRQEMETVWVVLGEVMEEVPPWKGRGREV